tara:strand:+ start:5210 stop:5656 length:447 start_codon:yes stop_codon:yes gene_type:complete
MIVTRRTTLALFAATIATPVFAAKAKIFVGNNGFAINGYDPVAYFTQSTPVEGMDSYKSEYMDATFLFSSAENKAMFDENPAQYAPQYGGYCAYAVSKGYTAKTEPDAWTVVDDRLYLNFDTGVRDVWRRDIPGNIERANANWPDVVN